jgi:hypothetical protein
MSQHEKIIAIMMSEPSKWWHSEDLMQHGDIFVGYKAQARISELALRYPEMIERQPSSKGNRQHMYRFRMENHSEFLPKLSQDMRDFVFSQKPWGVNW